MMNVRSPYWFDSGFKAGKNGEPINTLHEIAPEMTEGSSSVCVDGVDLPSHKDYMLGYLMGIEYRRQEKEGMVR